MPSIDYQEARKEIEKIFARNDLDRQIIFWYDAPANFKDDIAADFFDFCKLIICEQNEFAVKRILEHEDTTSDYLLYFPYEKPVDTENWLLDILMYSEEYYADTVALTMRRLNLTNTDLRYVIENHIKFFDAESRIKKLSTYIEINDKMNPDEFKVAMICVLVKAASRSIDDILTELVFDCSSGTKYAEMKKYGFEEYLLDKLAVHYNYSGELKIEQLIRRFMFTALLGQKADFGDLSSFYQQYQITEDGKNDARFFVDRLKNDKRYTDLQLSLAVDLKIDTLLIPRDISCVENADIFECIDEHIIKKIAESLRNGSLDYDSFERIISSRMNSMWYEKHRSEYELLSAAISLFKRLDHPIDRQLLAVEYIKKYTQTYYLVDTYYRHVCTSYREIENPIIEIEGLMDRVELSYQTKFLDVLGKEYSDALKEQETWEFLGIESSHDFFWNVAKQNYKKCFVIISDGLRYEIGQELYEKIRMDPILKGTDEIRYAISPLPSETRFGMAALLPHQTTEYANEAVSVDAMATNSTAFRDSVLKKKDCSYAAIRFSDIIDMSKNDLRAYMAEKSLVYVYHNVIDNTGEHDEANVFSVSARAIDDILKLIRRLFNNLQISNFYVTADHGFVYRRNSIQESMKYSDIVSLNPTEVAKRYVITNNCSLTIPYTTEFILDKISNGDYKVITPYGYDIFKTQGGGYQYIHGGASLQETIVPIIHISELSAAKAKEAVTPVGVRLKSITRKITNRSFSLEFEQYERVQDRKQAITCETYIADESGNIVSGVYKFVAASESEDLTARTTKIRFNLMNIPFDRSQRYYLILKNTDRPDEYLEKECMVIDILNLKIL